MKTFTLLIFVAASLSSCHSTEGGLTSGPIRTEVPGSAAGAIAGDMAGRFAEQTGSAGTTSIKMHLDQTDYAVALELALKGWGYAVVTDGKVPEGSKSVEISYSLDSFDDEILASLTTSSVAIGRAYTLSTTGADPASPFSIMLRN